MSNVFLLVIGCGFLALLYGVYAIRSVLAAPAGTDRMQEIAGAIQEGANAYLNRQYKAIAVAGLVIGVLLGLALGLVQSLTECVFRDSDDFWAAVEREKPNEAS